MLEGEREQAGETVERGGQIHSLGVAHLALARHD